MKVRVFAYTVIGVPSVLEGAGYFLHDDIVNSSDELAEFALRFHINDFDPLNQDRASNQDVVDHAVSEGNTGIFDHASASLLVSGATRRLGFELDSRFHTSGLKVHMPRLQVDEHNIHFAIPDAIAQHAGLAAFVEDLWEDAAIKAYTHLLERLQDKGHDASEAARLAECVLPSTIETSLLISGTMNAWRDVTIMALRQGTASDEAVCFATKALVQLKMVAPHTFRDR